MKQLSIDQQEVLFESLMEVPKFRPEGWPTKYKVMDFDEYTDEEIKYIHDWFITLQYSDDPTLEGEDIRGVQIYPYLDL